MKYAVSWKGGFKVFNKFDEAYKFMNEKIRENRSINEIGIIEIKGDVKVLGVRE